MPDRNLPPKDSLHPLPQDPRDFQLGALFTLPEVSELPPDFEFSVKIKDQGSSDFCTAFSSTLASELQEDTELSPEYVFAQAKKLAGGDVDSFGLNLRDIAKAHVKIGTVEKSEAPFSLENQNQSFLRRIENWPVELEEKAKKHRKQSYLAPFGDSDFFDDIRRCIYKFRDEERAVFFGVMFGWSLSQKIIDTIPDNGFGHAMAIVGWQTINRIPYLKVANSAGTSVGENGFHYFSREVINHFVGLYGAYMFLDKSKEELEYLIEAGIKENDYWFVKILKRIYYIFTVPQFTKEEKNALVVDTINNEIKASEPRLKLLQKALDYLGKDASPTNQAPPELACAESVSFLINECFGDFPRTVSTTELASKLKSHPKFKGTLDLLPGNVIVSPTGMGNGKIPNGHTGIFGEKGKIMSNQSSTGKWEQNYDVNSWVARYRTDGGYPLWIFTRV